MFLFTEKLTRLNIRKSSIEINAIAEGNSRNEIGH